MSIRIEKNSLEEVQVPADKYYGVQTQHAVENFPVSGRALPPEVVKESLRTGKSLKEIILDRKILTPEELERALHPERITQPGILKKSED